MQAILPYRSSVYAGGGYYGARLLAVQLASAVDCSTNDAHTARMVIDRRHSEAAAAAFQSIIDPEQSCLMLVFVLVASLGVVRHKRHFLVSGSLFLCLSLPSKITRRHFNCPVRTTVSVVLQ